MVHVPSIVDANFEHLEYIQQNMRDADRDELWAAYSMDPAHCLMISMMSSTRCWTGLVDGVPICMFGVVPASLVESVGRPWMIGTPAVEKFDRIFLKHCHEVVKNMASEYKTLYNFVDLRNKKAIRWLRWLGFTMEEPAPFGPFNLPFRRFTMEDKCTR